MARGGKLVSLLYLHAATLQRQGGCLCSVIELGYQQP